MSENTVKARLRHAVKPEATWTSDNPVLKEGEVGYVKETGRYKVGDGKTAWNSLAWAQPSSHTHDDRYYTETEINTKLKTKSDNGHTHNYAGSSSAGGSANSAVKLATPKTINGTSFDGSGNITTANWGTSRNITIGNTKKAVNGSGDVSWSLAEIGASASNHTHTTLKPFIQTSGNVTSTNSYFRVARISLNTINVKYNNDENKWASWRQERVTFLAEGRFIQAGIINVCVETVGVVDVTGQSNKIQYYLSKGVKATISTFGVPRSYISVSAMMTSSNQVYVDVWFRHGEYNTTSIYCLGRSSETGTQLITTFSVSAAITSPDYTYYDCSVVKTSYSDTVETTNIAPIANNIYTIGTSTNKWNNIYATTFTGNATSATALTTSAGSATQPVYFSSGKPVACTYTLAKSVPADAKFTDTNTWRGIQNNLTSDSASDSLAAVQGKALKTLIDGKASSTHTHTKSQITDFPTSLKNPTSLILRLNGGATEGTNQFTYDGSAAKTVSITPAGIGAATSGHNHDSAYLGKTATAAAATKLATARTVSAATDFNMSFSYDGSANSTASLGYYSCISSVQNMNNYPFHRFAKIDKLAATYNDRVSTFLITQDFQGGGWGIVRLALRTNSSTTVSDVEVKWLCRVGFPVDFVQVGIYNVAGSTYADAFLKHGGTYTGTVVRNLASGARGNISRTWTLINSSEVSGTTVNDAKTSTEVYATIAAAGTALHKQAYSKTVVAVDGGTVLYANTSDSSTKATQDSAGQQINTTYIKGLSVNGKTITYTRGDNTTGTITTQDTDSHYTTGLKVCASATGTTHATATNGKMRINVLDNTTVRDSIIIQGTGATTVTSDASGVITINSPSYSTGTTSTAGLTKLYTSTGTSTDGTMTRKAITDALSGKAASNHNHDGDYVPLENGAVTVSSDMGAYVDLQDTNGGAGTHLSMTVKGASKWDLAANSNGELSLTYITSAGSNWLYAMNASGISMYQSVTVRPSPLATTANSMMVKVSTAGLQNFTGRTISLYASGSDNNYAGLYDHDNGWILYYDTSKVVHIPREITSGSLTTSGNLQWRNSSGTAYVIAGTLSNDNYKNMTRVGNLTYETGIYTKTNVWKNGSTTTYFATTSTSDQRLKEKISDMSVYEDFFYKLKPFAFKYHEGLYNANGTKPMIQWGYGAQDTVKAFEESGLDWKQEELVVIEDGELTDEEKKYATDGQMLKMNYQNMSALNTHMIQKCLSRIDDLERQLAELKKEG